MTTSSTIPNIKDARRATYYTTIDLREGRSGHFQLVFASQVYGTFFGIYARFDFTPEASRMKLDRLTFRIINYKGQINIGIDSVSQPEFDPQDPKKLEMKFYLKGYMPPLQDYECDFSGDEIYLEDGSEITFKRSMGDFTQNLDDIFVSGVFDDEFYFRDGLFPIEAPVAALEKQVEQKYPDSTIGRRCPWSLVKVSTAEQWPT